MTNKNNAFFILLVFLILYFYLLCFCLFFVILQSLSLIIFPGHLSSTFMWKTGDPEMATPKRVRTYRPKHSDTSLSREWRINVENKKKK